MTNIRVDYGSDMAEIVTTGHAGSDQICTAISAIVQSLAGWAIGTESGTAKLEKGSAEIHVNRAGCADGAIDMTVIGLMQVLKIAPEEVKMVINDMEITI